MIFRLVLRQRDCHIGSQPERKKWSKMWRGIAQECPKRIQKRGRERVVWLRQQGRMGTEMDEIASKPKVIKL